MNPLPSPTIIETLSFIKSIQFTSTSLAPSITQTPSKEPHKFILHIPIPIEEPINLHITYGVLQDFGGHEYTLAFLEKVPKVHSCLYFPS